MFDATQQHHCGPHCHRLTAQRHNDVAKTTGIFFTLNPNEAVEEVELPASVGPGPPVSPSDFVGLFSEAGVLSDFIQNVRWKGAIFLGLENHT